MTDEITEAVSMAIRLSMRKGSSFDDAATAAITAYRESVAAAGYKLVPIEPTQEMIDAWRMDQAQLRSLQSSYRAMIEAAPEAP